MLPEEKARVKIDKQLRNAGWDIVARDEYGPNSTSAIIFVYGSYPFECDTLPYFASICHIMYRLSNVHLTDEHFFYQK